MAWVTVRPRTDRDTAPLAALAARERPGGYPPPGVDLGIEPGWIESWVADGAGEVIGHVALRAHVSDAVTRHASEILGVEEPRLGVVKRLVVAQTRRGQGVGRQLLDVATTHAMQEGLVPILDTWVENPASMRFFEALGWVPLGQVELVVGNEAGVFRPVEAIYHRPNSRLHSRVATSQHSDCGDTERQRPEDLG